MRRALRAAVARRPTRAKRGDEGFSLVEVMVGIALFTVVGGLITGLAVTMLRTGEGIRGRLGNVDQLRVAMDAVTKELRTAVRPEQLNPTCTTAPCGAAFTTAEGSSATFFANHGVAGQARLTTFRVEQDPDRPGTARLVQEQRASAVPTASPDTACGAGCADRVLAANLAWPVEAPVFTYADGACADFGPAPTLADISCVAVDLPVEGGRDHAGTSARSTVFLPNSVMGR